MIRYIFREPLTIKNASKADAQQIGESLAKITEVAAGRLEPKAVVDAARAPRHVLHKHFEWDDKVAAESYRVDQARELIRCVRIVDDDKDDEPIAAFLSVSDKGGVAYHSAQEVATSADLQIAVMKQAERDLAAWQKRYRELSDYCAAVSNIRAKINRAIERQEARVQ